MNPSAAFPRLAIWLMLILALVLPAGAAPAGETRYAKVLAGLCDTLVAAQITDPASPDYGALVCPSSNPQLHPLHSRAAEAVYPLVIVWQQTHDVRYRDAAIRLGRWLITKQQPSGAWGENWPKHNGWAGTTCDQLISLAGAWPLLRGELPAADQAVWEHSMRQAADYIVQTFPVNNINYQITGAVALVLATQALPGSPDAWRSKADALRALTLAAVNTDGLLTGEGHGVDLGYNLAQSIGYIALFGRLTGDETLRDRAADLLRTHSKFVYPNGSVDNSWGTRSFKWLYESGTKTAPGVYFTFAMLADKDPDFGPTGLRCLDYLTTESLDHGLVTYGPHADRHDSTNPPCLYGTFVRAQSIALAVTYAPGEPAKRSEAKANPIPRVDYFPSVKVAVVRTEKIMATVSAYGEIRQYARELVSRGGSLTNLWIDGFGPRGQAQTSSVTRYKCQEAAHMPNEGDLLPLTPRVECTVDGVYYTNLYETDGVMQVSKEADHIVVKTTGQLRSVKGKSADISYGITHCFYADHLTKEYVLEAPAARRVRIIEPFVHDEGTTFTQDSPQRFLLHPTGSPTWALAVTGNGLHIDPGPEAGKYWCPFPAIEAYPLILDLDLPAGAPSTATLSLGPAEGHKETRDN